jgi:hypothetical protein
MSQLFRDICFLTMLKKRLKEGHLYDEIIIDSLALKKAIKKNFYKYHFKVNYKGRSALRIYLGKINSYFKIFKQISFSFLEAWFTRKYKRIVKTDRALTLLDVFVFKMPKFQIKTHNPIITYFIVSAWELFIMLIGFGIGWFSYRNWFC